VRIERASFAERFWGNEVDFEYAALSFANEKLVGYKTRLSGYDEEWSNEKTDVAIRYTNLPAFLLPKTYVFQVMARNNDGVWTETAVEHSFTVQPPWWFRWWSIASAVALILVSTYSSMRHRTRQLERRSKELERIVDERTLEIRQKAAQIERQKEELSVKNLELEEKNAEILRTQQQLIMQEKLASLGALTAGIAHEIKNPLNFVNNFSEVSAEILADVIQDFTALKDQIDPKLFKRIEADLSDLQENARKINEHGKRADGIVKGMLEHSRGKTGERVPVDLNKLLEEYVNLAYHGMQAQDSGLTISIQTDFDPSAGEIIAVPQDLSRVFLNLVNNACYAANEKRKSAGAGFVPTVSVTTKNLGEKVEVRIRDNGTGIPKSIVEKIFNPFFTTKPTGKGTGLGLSLSHDIVVKQHNGEIAVETEEGSFSEFIIRLPRK
jgi:signal transduction histidine kinase